MGLRINKEFKELRSSKRYRTRTNRIVTLFIPLRIGLIPQAEL